MSTTFVLFKRSSRNTQNHNNGNDSNTNNYYYYDTGSDPLTMHCCFPGANEHTHTLCLCRVHYVLEANHSVLTHYSYRSCIISYHITSMQTCPQLLPSMPIDTEGPRVACVQPSNCRLRGECTCFGSISNAIAECSLPCWLSSGFTAHAWSGGRRGGAQRRRGRRAWSCGRRMCRNHSNRTGAKCAGE